MKNEIPVLYTTKCPKCRVLETKLEEKCIEFAENSDIETMKNLGIDQVPVLYADGKYMEFKEAVQWVNSK